MIRGSGISYTLRLKKPYNSNIKKDYNVSLLEGVYTKISTQHIDLEKTYSLRRFTFLGTYDLQIKGQTQNIKFAFKILIYVNL